MHVVGEAGNGRTALAGIAALHPQVLVLDVSMPDMNGLVVTRTLQGKPGPAIVALTRHTDRAYVQELLGAGATAYVLKQSPSTELLRAIRAAGNGRQYMDPHLASRTAATPLGRTFPDPPRSRITDRETEVLKLMALGHSNKDIAASLDLSVKTVEVHKANAMRKLKLNGRTDIVRYALLQGWLQEP
jgi:DNA-binding NarL/FixJ family response regulator